MSTLVIRGGDVVVGHETRRLDVLVEDGRIAAVGPEAVAGDAPHRSDVLDADGHLVAPGFIDLQCNGVDGQDLTSDPDTLGAVARALPRFGVTAFCPTIVTSPRSAREAAIDAWTAGTGGRAGAAVPLGLHLEGPMLAPEHAGAHDRALLATPERTEVESWVGSGAVRMVTLAPELPGAVDLVGLLAAGGVTVAAGHTGMGPEHLGAARAAGLTYVTHLFNAMSRFHHRAPSAVATVLADDVVVAGMICDGHHVHPDVVRMARRVLGAGRVSLVSDASAALGTSSGTVRLGGLDVTSDAGPDAGSDLSTDITTDGPRSTVHGAPPTVRLADGTLAGSAVGLDVAVRNYVAFTGCSALEAIATVTTVPAAVLGLDDRGVIEVGASGDLTVLAPGLRPVATVIGGHVAWRS
jgi:N-acetylglucosamine-6-phosphate deacetylase